MTMKQINEQTSIPFKVAVPVCLTLISCTYYLGGLLAEIRTGVKQSWTIRQMQTYSDVMRDSNPGLHVPNPNEVVERSQQNRNNL